MGVNKTCKHQYFEDKNDSNQNGFYVGCNKEQTEANCSKCGWNPNVAKQRLETGIWKTGIVELDLYKYDENDQVIGTAGTRKAVCNTLKVKT